MAAPVSGVETGGRMATIEDLAGQLRQIGSVSTPAEIGAAIGLLEQLTLFLPEPAGRLASVGLLIARDQALAGRTPEDMEALRSSVRVMWQGELDRRFPNG
jgi:hypothetical protein